jgi:di/tricarboxylate transporter
VVPITISTFQQLGLNPIPFVYIVAAIGNCGYVLPSSSGGTAVAGGYGVNLKTMAAYGVWLSIVSAIALLLMGYILTIAWPGFGLA